MKQNPYSAVPQLLRKKVDGNVLASILCLVLDEAEDLFGSKIEPYPYMFAGIDFGLTTPQLRFTGLGKAQQYKYISIRLSRSCERDRKRALWQLIHESVHLLSPCLKSQMPVLEEGMACWYQRRWVAKCPSAFSEWAKKPDHG